MTNDGPHQALYELPAPPNLPPSSSLKGSIAGPLWLLIPRAALTWNACPLSAEAALVMQLT